MPAPVRPMRAGWRSGGAMGSKACSVRPARARAGLTGFTVMLFLVPAARVRPRSCAGGIPHLRLPEEFFRRMSGLPGRVYRSRATRPGRDFTTRTASSTSPGVGKPSSHKASGKVDSSSADHTICAGSEETGTSR